MTTIPGVSGFRWLGLVASVAALTIAAACGGSTGSSEGAEPASTATASPGAQPAPAGSSDEIAGLARSWYEAADPAVCDRMTETMLDSGWGKTGDQGRAECRTLLSKADPAVDVVVGSPTIDGDKATVEVTYGPADNRKIDRLHFVLVGGLWNVDAIGGVRTPAATNSEGS